MTGRTRAPALATRPGGPARLAGGGHWLAAAAETARPRQWPKNLLVFAAPLAGASTGRDEGLGYVLAAALAFVAASAAVYYVNDVLDAGRDRQHPVKRLRAVASARLPAAHALALAGLAATLALAVGLVIGEPALTVILAAYLALSVLYGLVLKHLPVIELIFVATGFVFRALGGAAASGVPPSVWFLLVCSLGALMVAIAKRFCELTLLGRDQAARHRPVMRFYRPAWLRRAQWLVTAAMVVAYLLWAAGQDDPWIRGWHLVSALPLAAALIRFGWLTGRADGRPVEDLIARDPVMITFELGWLVTFAAGL
ncbi:MAG TPA: decaprenyl-phosphate phosphoribosyltransferase [Streptosporangiaceae bacterium]